MFETRKEAFPLQSPVIPASGSVTLNAVNRNPMGPTSSSTQTVTAPTQWSNPGNFIRLRGRFTTDQAFTVIVDQSDDGTTWDNVLTSASQPASTVYLLDVLLYLPIARIRVTNGSTTTATTAGNTRFSAEAIGV